MEITNTSDLVKRLKVVKAKRNLSFTDIMVMLEEINQPLAESTIRRVFADGSETKNFSYDVTLKPLANLLLEEDDSDDAISKAISKDRIDGLLEVISIKNDAIKQLQDKVEELKSSYDARCLEYENRMKFLRNQIELKDTRMDRKDAIIEKLLDQVLICNKCPVEKNK